MPTLNAKVDLRPHIGDPPASLFGLRTRAGGTPAEAFAFSPAKPRNEILYHVALKQEMGNRIACRCPVALRYTVVRCPWKAHGGQPSSSSECSPATPGGRSWPRQ